MCLRLISYAGQGVFRRVYVESPPDTCRPIHRTYDEILAHAQDDTADLLWEDMRIAVKRVLAKLLPQGPITEKPRQNAAYDADGFK